MTIGLGHYLVVSAILLVLGIFGIFLNRKNVIIILMSIELILLAVNLNLVAFSAALGDLAGQVFAMFVLTVAAAEAAVGLAILVTFFRNRGDIAVDDAATVAVVQSLQDSIHHPVNRTKVKPLPGREHLLQRWSINKLHDDVGTVLRRDIVVDPDDVGVE